MDKIENNINTNTIQEYDINKMDSNEETSIENANVVGIVYNNVAVILGSISETTDICCICRILIIEEYLMPSKCLSKNGVLSHKICKKCWFKSNGFGTEGVNHNCPGCINGLILGKKNKQSVPIIIDLTDDSSSDSVSNDSIYSDSSFGIDSGYDSYFDDVDDKYCEIDI